MSAGNEFALVLREMGCIWEYPGTGFHADFTLASRHSGFYFNSNEIVQDPGKLETVCERIEQEIVRRDLTPTWVVSYPPFGTPFALILARKLGVRFGYVQSVEQMEIFFEIGAEDRVLVVADDIYGGTTMTRLLELLSSMGAEVEECVFVVANFTGRDTIAGKKIVSLYERVVEMWSPSECPLCDAGSTAISARRHWPRFARR